MSSKGFGKNKHSKKRKTNKLIDTIEDSEALIQIGLVGGQLIQQVWNQDAQNFRQKAEKEYGTELIKARSLILCLLFDLLKFKAGIPGKKNDNIGERLVLINVFAQGQWWTEKLISEGQPIKAAAVLKQDIEIVTRLYEIRQGVAQFGKVPNMKYAPTNLKELYGDMNNIAHISKAYILENICTVVDSKGIKGVSLTPLFHAEDIKKLYELHINLCLIVTGEAINLFREMYGDDEEMLLPPLKLLDAARELLIKTGWMFTN